MAFFLPQFLFHFIFCILLYFDSSDIYCIAFYFIFFYSCTLAALIFVTNYTEYVGVFITYGFAPVPVVPVLRNSSSVSSLSSSQMIIKDFPEIV